MYRVILVDDEPYGIQALRRLMNWEKCGFIIAETCEGSEEALSAILQHSPHLVVTDIRMPEMDGLALIAQAKKLDGLQVQPFFVVMSGYLDFQYAQQALHLGVSHYLTKPVMSEEVEDVLGIVRKKIDAQQQSRTLAPHAYSISDSLGDGKLGDKVGSIQIVEQYVHDNFRHPLTIKDIAERFHYNPVYLGQAFAKRFGMGMLEYIHELRIAEAVQLLQETELSTASIAETVGYIDYSRFVKQFMKRRGMRPSEYKQSIRSSS